MRGLDAHEREVVTNSLKECRRAPGAGATLPTWSEISDKYGQAWKKVTDRGLIQKDSGPCQCGGWHSHTTTVGKLALELDTAARNLEINRDWTV